MAWWQWSRTASADATADPTINWSEGQAPSSVNDSARALMARLAEFRDDTSGLLTTAGTSTAYTITTFQGLATIPNDGQLIAFSPHTVNGIAATLTADGGTTYPIQSSPGVALAAGSLVTGSPYTAKFSLSNLSWILFGFYANPFNVPLASGFVYFGTAVPNSNFAFPFGQAISRTTYATLFALTGTTYGVGDGVNTFNLPDLRGRVPAGKDDMGGSAASRLTAAYFGQISGQSGATLGAVGGLENMTLIANQLPSNIPYSDTGHSHQFFVNIGGGVGGNVAGAALAGPANTANTGSATITSMTINPSGGNPHRTVQPTLIANYVMRIL